jgi:hypothetical protein
MTVKKFPMKMILRTCCPLTTKKKSQKKLNSIITSKNETSTLDRKSTFFVGSIGLGPIGWIDEIKKGLSQIAWGLKSLF